ncbi:hypothetical protein SDC9_176914 [bioreactor metagenome]|uniref:Uncharacterized protein n=1 Tax=bioreactor metagenome TaxID=1076179 RepID=A0A645GRH4_9ZZZZ
MPGGFADFHDFLPGFSIEGPFLQQAAHCHINRESAIGEFVRSPLAVTDETMEHFRNVPASHGVGAFHIRLNFQ